VIAEHLSGHLPGNPVVNIEAVEGARGVQLARQMATTEPKDGSVVAMTSMSVLHNFLIDPAGYDFSVADTVWLGAFANTIVYCVTARANPAALTDEGIIIGAANKASDFYRNGMMLKNLINPSAQLVSGFTNEVEIMAALERGEIQAYCGPTRSTYEREKRADIQQIVAGIGDPQALEARGVSDLFKDVDGLDRDVLEFSTFPTKWFYTMGLPAGTSPEIAEVYREALRSLNADVDFIAEFTARVPEYQFRPGDMLSEAIKIHLATDPAVIERARQITQ
jgi:hypothetical protein